MSWLRGLLVGLEAPLTLATGYLLTLLVAAVIGRRHSRKRADEQDRMVIAVLVPAHDEEGVIEGTLASLQKLEYPRDQHSVVVIADNCRDRTAVIAAAHGATVYERFDEDRRGKGHALAWAIDRLFVEQPAVEAIVVVDADCTVSPNLLSAIASRFRSGADAVQVRDRVANPTESWASALRHAAFELFNTIRPLGKSSLGLSCGLLGTGMGLTRAQLERLPWTAYSVTEDGEYHLRLVEAGGRVEFVPEASVSSPMPTSLGQAYTQQHRWESGKWIMARSWTRRLVVKGVRRRSAVMVHAALELLVPPQSLLLGLNAILGGLAILARSRMALVLFSANLTGQAIYVLGGLRLVGAPASTYRALLLAPLLSAWKIGLYLTLLAGKQPHEWVKTARVAQAQQREVTLRDG
jgi:hypothetical protein